MITKNASLSLCFDGCCFLLLLSYNRRFLFSLWLRRHVLSHVTSTAGGTHVHSIVNSQHRKTILLSRAENVYV